MKTKDDLWPGPLATAFTEQLMKRAYEETRKRVLEAFLAPKEVSFGTTPSGGQPNKCPVCGGEHETVQVAGIEIVSCPDVPDDQVLLVDPMRPEKSVVMKNIGSERS